MLALYKYAMRLARLPLLMLLSARRHAGKEHAERLPERTGIPGFDRPDGFLIWLHAASVGEAQSTLILIQTMHGRFPDAHMLVTTGTVASAALMADRLPDYAIHQFYPLDHPAWVSRFLDHWRPDAALWLESEIWPSMLMEIQRRAIPAALVNGRLSDRSCRRWARAGDSFARILAAFGVILAQTEQDAANFRRLGARHVRVAENLKYGSALLPVDPEAQSAYRHAVGARPAWLYASSHAGEEALACRVHRALRPRFPDLLTVIVPRHASRMPDVAAEAQNHGLRAAIRSQGALPAPSDDLYIADTIGELGLFYRECPVALIGRSFSDDGGGGHNPFEAAQLGSVVLYGPQVQNLQAIYDDMTAEGAAFRCATEDALTQQLEQLLAQPALLAERQRRGFAFVENRRESLQSTLDQLNPMLDSAWASHRRARGHHATENA